MRIPKLIPAAALLVLAVPALHAEAAAARKEPQKAQPSQPAQGKTLFAEMDVNHDGKITREEWKGNAIGFAMLDANGDGVLSGDELKPKR